ncbi:MAG: anion permease, partial [Thermoanaerobaculia bacterium]|nr:anion permease [Thermoanaerobaculia bacterium]
MTFEILLLLALLAATLALFVTERLPLEVTAMSLLASLLLLGTVSLDEAIAGFSNKAVVTVGAMFVLGHALVKTGALEIAADRLSQRLGRYRWLGLALPLTAASLLSGVLNNTAVVAIFIPLAIDLCRRLDLSPSRVLLPLSYAAILGGTLTLIGTSTNLLVSALSEDAGEGPIRMFELAPMG